MVLGIGEGKIDIVLEKFDFSPGEKIKGKVKLDLKSPKKARELRVILVGERTIPTRERGKRKERIEYFRLVLDKEKEYTNSEYDFEFTVPTTILKKPEEGVEKVLETVLSIGQMLGVTPSPIKWFIQATLDIPMGFDINKWVQINII